MRQSFLTILLLLIPLMSAGENTSIPEQVFFEPWGEHIEYREAPGGRFGPRSFVVESGQVYLLNTNHNQIDMISAGAISTVMQVPPYADDFAIAGEEIYVLHNNRVTQVSAAKQSEMFQPDEARDVIAGLSANTNDVVIRLANGNSRVLEQNRGTFRKESGYFFSEERILSVRKTGEHTVELRAKSGNRSEQVSSINFQSGLPVGSVQLLGVDKYGRTFLLVDYIRQQVPLEVQSVVQVYDAEMKLQYKITVPQVRYTYLFKRFQVTEDGLLYHLISAEDGMYLYRWDLPDTEKTTPVDLEYPEPLNSATENYNEVPFEEYSPDFPKDMPRMSPTSVTRNQALATGDTYVQHTWDCQSFNLANGTVTAPDGDFVETPSWLSVGEMQKVPYQWGGFRSLGQFDSGIASGGYAGDIHTAGVTSYAYGVDCSGFVSRCWNLPYQYSTSMMPQITGQYTTWQQLLPGDAIHKVGHVRMMVEWNQNGTMNVVESSGADWRVSYRNYSTGQLSAYTPRYYVDMEGAPTPLPTPTFESVTVLGDTLQLEWNCAQWDGVAGYHLYHSFDGASWTLAQPTTSLPLSMSATGIQYDGSSEVYYRLKTVDGADTTRESLMSDLYGVYRPEESANPVLIVDGFDRYGGSGSWDKAYHPFALKIGKALTDLNVPFETCANETVIDGNIDLTEYASVVWILGDESTADETFSTAEQALVSAYLENGGQLFVSGSEIGWDLDNRGDNADRSFYNQYLKASYAVDDAGVYTAVGVTNSIFDGLEVQFDNGNHGIYEEDYPDGLAVNAGGVVAMSYQNSQHAAAIQYDGTFGDGNEPAKLVYLAFPAGTIYDNAQFTSLFDGVMTFFGYETVTDVHDVTPKDYLANSFRLQQNYPNPFNPSTTFLYSVPGAGEVLLAVFNVKGQQIFSRNLRYGHGGQFSATIDLSNQASGTYFTRFTWHGASGKRQTSTQKILLVK